MVPQHTRRRVLLAGGLAVGSTLSGCTSLLVGGSGGGSLPDVTIENQSDTRREYALTITKQGASAPVYTDSATLDAGKEQQYEDPMTEDGPHDVQLVSETVERTVEYGSCGANDACSLNLYIATDEILFVTNEGD